MQSPECTPKRTPLSDGLWLQYCTVALLFGCFTVRLLYCTVAARTLVCTAMVANATRAAHPIPTGPSLRSSQSGSSTGDQICKAARSQERWQTWRVIMDAGLNPRMNMLRDTDMPSSPPLHLAIGIKVSVDYIVVDLH